MFIIRSGSWTEARAKIPVFYLWVPPLLREKTAWPFMSSSAIRKLPFSSSGPWKLRQLQCTSAIASVCSLQQYEETHWWWCFVPLCSQSRPMRSWHLIDSWGRKFWNKVNALGIIHKFTNTGDQLPSQGYLSHFPRGQEHPPPPVVKKD